MIFRISLENKACHKNERRTTYIICIYMPNFLLMKSIDHVVHETANNYLKKCPLQLPRLQGDVLPCPNFFNQKSKPKDIPLTILSD